jgi:hypothetical protein
VTLHATRDVGHHDGTVTIHVTYGPVTVRVTEPEGHVLQFWHDLGKLVAAEDNEKRARAGYERYAEDAGYKAVNGDSMPSWADMKLDVRKHWVAAFTE